VLIDRAGSAGGPSGKSAAMLRQHYSDPAVIQMAKWGCDFLAGMQERTGSDPGFVNCGYLVIGGPEREPHIRRAYEAMRAEGVAVELIDVEGVRALEPRLALDDIVVGCFEPTVGYCQPLFVADGFARSAERGGATLELGREVVGLRPDGAGWKLHLRDRTTILAEACIVACGPWSNRLIGPLGGKVPLALRRGQAGRFRPKHAFGDPGPIISDHEQELWIKPDGSDGHYLVGGRGGRLDRGPHWRHTGQQGADDDTLEHFAGELARRFPGMEGGIWRGSWSSYYDFTPDGNPVVDFVPRRRNLIIATGMSGHAFKLAPSIGRGAAELLVDGAVTSFDWSVFAYGRFTRTGGQVAGGRGPG
jgi:glycine/D-amino acid oxidase-like deaminating enzyme